MVTKIQLRRDIAENWTNANPVLDDGEVGIEKNTRKFKFGNGSTPWNDLPYVIDGQIPTKISQLENDVDYIILDDVEAAGFTKNIGTVTAINNVGPDANGNVSITIPTKTSDLTNDENFTTLQAVANEGYTKNIGTVTKVNNTTPDNTGNVSISIPTSTNDLSNDSGFITIDDVATEGYTKNKGTVTKVNNTTPDAEGNVSIAIPPEVTDTTVANWGYTKNQGTVKFVNSISPNANGNVSLAIPSKTSDLTNDANFTTLAAVAEEGYTKNEGTVTSVNDSTPDANGNVSLAIPPEVTDSTVSEWGYTKNVGTVISVNNESPDANGNVTITIPSGTWGDISGTLSNQTDLNDALGTKLQAANIIQGTNITLNKDGNNITINATGEISGTVNWGDIEGEISAQTDLDNKLRNVEAATTALSPLVIDGTETPVYAPTATSDMTSGEHQWYICNKFTPGEGGAWLVKIINNIEHTATEPATDCIVHLGLCKVDLTTNKITCTRRIPDIVFNVGTEVELPEPIFVEEDEYVMLGQNINNSTVKWGYVSSLDGWDKYYFNAWNNPKPGDTVNVSTTSYPHLASGLGPIFKKNSAPDMNAIIADIDNKLNTSDFHKAFDPIDEMFHTTEDVTVVPGTVLDTNTLSGPYNTPGWICDDWKAPCDGRFKQLQINLKNAITADKTLDIAVIHVTITDPDAGTGTWTLVDKITGLTVPNGTAAGLYAIDLPHVIELKENDYFVIRGTLEYTSLSTARCILNKLNPWTNTSGSWNGIVDKYIIKGFRFVIEKDVYTSPNGRIDAMDERVTDIEQTLTDTGVIGMEQTPVFNKIITSNVSPASPNAIYWLDKRDVIWKDGYICEIRLVGNNWTLPETPTCRAAIGAFIVNPSETQGEDTATMTRFKEFVWDTSSNTFKFASNELFEVHTGETVGLLIPGYQKYFTGVTFNCINGGNIDTTRPGDTISGHYNGSFSYPAVFIQTDRLTLPEQVENIYDRLDDLDVRTEDLTTSTSYKDLTSVMLIGSSLTEASYCPTFTSWPERLNDIVDVTIYNNGLSGANIFSNLDRLSKDGDLRFAPGNISNPTSETCKARDLNPTYFLWDDCANGSPTGQMAIQLYRKVKACVESYGAKLLMGSEENYANQANKYEQTQQSFATEAGIPYSAITRIQNKCYPRGRTDVCPYPVNGSSHAGYRANAPYQIHRDLIEKLPIYKNLKMFHVRMTYKDGEPTIADLNYDNNLQRLKYWTALHPGQGASTPPGHIDNLDGNVGQAYDVPGTTNISPSGSRCEEADLFRGDNLTFNKWALIEGILEKVDITHGTFEIETNVEPTAMYIANYKPITFKGANGGTAYKAGEILLWNTTPAKFYTVLRDFTSANPWAEPDPADAELMNNFDDYVRTEFEPLSFVREGTKVTAHFDNTGKHYQTYDKVRIIMYYAGGDFVVSKPRFYNYDGINKVLPENIPFEQRRFGKELIDVVNPSTWSGAVEKSLPAPIANYTLYNDTLAHAEMSTEGWSGRISRTIALGDDKGPRKIAVRIVSQLWQKIATLRYIGTEWENNEYITSSKDDPLGTAAYINSDYDYGMLRVTINDNISKNILVYPGWNEAYFEADLTENDTNLRIIIEKVSYVDDSYNNDDKPIFIHHVSAQDLGTP